MIDGQNKPDEPPSLVDLVGNVFTTVAEIGWSLVAAGRGVLSVASRLVRLAHEQIRPHVGDWGLDRRPRSDLAAPEHGVGHPPQRPPRASSAVALEDEIQPAFTPIAEEHRPRPGLAASADVSVAPLPDHYGRDRLVALARDPESLFVWWEVTDATRRAALDRAPARDASGSTPSEGLRITALDGDGPPAGPGTWLVPVPPFATSRYVQVPRIRRRFEIVLGLIADGVFTPLLAAVSAETPASDIASNGEVRWRVAGDRSGSAAPAEVPAPVGVESLWQQLRSTPLPASSDWAAGHRLLELEIGGSHDLPSS